MVIRIAFFGYTSRTVQDARAMTLLSDTQIKPQDNDFAVASDDKTA